MPIALVIYIVCATFMFGGVIKLLTDLSDVLPKNKFVSITVTGLYVTGFFLCYSFGLYLYGKLPF
jgi:hypothetical protein